MRLMSESTIRSRYFLKKHIFLIVLILLQVTTFHRWIFQDSLFTFGDVGVFTRESQLELLKNSLFFYSSDTSLGNVSIGSSTNPLLFLFGVFAFFGVNYIWSLKFIILFPAVFGVVLSSYFLIYKLTHSRRAAFFGALVYAYNSYFLITLTGALYLSLAYALSPFILLVFIRVLEHPTLSRKIALALTAALVGYIEFRILFITIWILAIYFFSFCFFTQDSMKRMFLRARDFILPSILFLLLNFFWILPLMKVGSIASNALFSRGLFGDSYFDIVNAFALFHPWWTGGMPAIFHKQVAGAFFFFVPLVALLTLFVQKRAKVVPFLIVFCVGVFLTKQSGEPFQPLYFWLYQHVPGFNAFREASKFFLVSSLGAAVLMGYFVAAKKTFSGVKKGVAAFLLVGVLIGCALQAKAVATGALETMFVPREFPVEYQVLNEFLNKDPDFARTLWFPHTNRFGTYSSNHPSISLLLNMETGLKDFIDPSQKNFSDLLYSPFTNEQFSLFLKNMAVRYIVVPSNLKWDDISSPWKNSRNYTERLDRLPYLALIDNPYFLEHDIHVYENKSWNPHLFVTTTPLSYDQEEEVERVNFDAVSPTEYALTMHIDRPVYLHFSENYHPDWRIRIGNFHWADSLFVKNYFLPENIHPQNDFHTNSFLVDPQIIRQSLPKESYQENADGSIDVAMTIYLSSQAFFSLGMLISVCAFIFCLLTLGYGIIILNNASDKGKKYE